jgi:DNA-directed RNA polymerase specialized sigma24 family protein
MDDQFEEKERDSKNEEKNLSIEEQHDLIQKTIACDRAAWDKLCKYYLETVIGYINGRIGNPHDAEVLATESFQRAERALKKGKYNPDYSFYTFLLHFSVRWVILKYWSKKHKKITIKTKSKKKEAGKVGEKLKEEGDQKRKDGGDEKITVTVKEISLSDLGAEDDQGHKIKDIPFGMPREEFDETVRRELLRLAFSCCAKPHQLLAFGFVKLLDWKPKEMVEEVSDWLMKELARKFFEDFYDFVEPVIDQQTFFEDIVTPLGRKVNGLVEIIYVEEEYEEIRTEFQGRPSGEIKLKKFYGKVPSHSWSDWVDKVRNWTEEVKEGKRFCS